ncbi:hypothetical protein M5Z41_11090, partial [Neisseria meningitidis]|nr:hypothetical protein [Neisseria meningitidis]
MGKLIVTYRTPTNEVKTYEKTSNFIPLQEDIAAGLKSFKSVRATNDALEVKLDIPQDNSTDKGNYTYELKNENGDVIDTEKVAAEDISKTVSLSMETTSNYTLTVINPDNQPVALY